MMLSDHAVQTTSITFNERLYTASYFSDGGIIVALIEGKTIRVHPDTAPHDETVKSELLRVAQEQTLVEATHPA